MSSISNQLGVRPVDEKKEQLWNSSASKLQTYQDLFYFLIKSSFIHTNVSQITRLHTHLYIEEKYNNLVVHCYILTFIHNVSRLGGLQINTLTIFLRHYLFSIKSIYIMKIHEKPTNIYLIIVYACKFFYSLCSKRAAQLFLDTDVSMTTICLYTSASRQSWAAFLGMEVDWCQILKCSTGTKSTTAANMNQRGSFLNQTRWPIYHFPRMYCSCKYYHFKTIPCDSHSNLLNSRDGQQQTFWTIRT
jgi:hypothetical protein